MTDTRHFPTLTLLPKTGRRVERGHLWVFANEVGAIEGAPAPGDAVVVRSGRGHFLGMGLYSSSSLIRARIYSRVNGEDCDADFIARRLAAALDYRRDVYRRATRPNYRLKMDQDEDPLPSVRIEPGGGEATPPSYRLVHGEADGLPGLVVDVFGVKQEPPHLVIQLTTAGMDRRRDEIVAALETLLSPSAIIERGDVAVRELEGLAQVKQVLKGELAGAVVLEEGGARLHADLLGGQKTGYFLDQACNRSWARPHLRGARVLDMFCYVGAWGIIAASAGAREIVGVDSSGPALALARRAAEELAAGLARPEFIEEDAFKFLRAACDAGREFDVVIVDPPALVKAKKDHARGLEAYRELNLRALQLLPPGGLLIACSCSHHVSRDEFREILVMAARDAARGRCKGADFILEREGGQGPDHPVHLATPETAYLKCFAVRRRG